MKLFKWAGSTTVVCLMFALIGSVVVHAATAPTPGAASPYGVAAGVFTNSLNTDTQTVINGGVCYTTAPTTPPITTNGTITSPCAPAVGDDQLTALGILNGQACTDLGAGPIALDAVIIGANPAGTFPPGCYFTAGAINITLSTTVTLNGSGVYVFRSGGALTTGQDSKVVLANGASASDVYWAPVAATSLGANTTPSLVTPTFVGNILDAAGITMGHYANLLGRALAVGGTVTTDSNTITVPTTLTVIKHVINNNGGAAVAGDFTLTIGGVTASGGNTVTGAESPGVIKTLTTSGAYTVTETVLTGYSQSSSADCSGAIAVGGTKTCTITNDDQAPSLTLNNIVVNDNSGTAAESAWMLTATGPTTISGAGAAGSADVVSGSTFSVGTYTLSQSAGPAGYTASSWSCVKNGGAPGTGASITLAVGDTATCTITNDDIAPVVVPSVPATVTPSPSGSTSVGTINVVKIVVNDSGGTKTVADFPLFVNGAPVVSGITNTYAAYADVYTVTESGSSRYVRTFSGDCDSNGRVNLNYGDHKFCIVTNNDIGAPVVVGAVPPLIDLVKVPSPLALPDGPGAVTYTYTLKNVGTVPVTDVTLVGDTCSPITLVSGDTNSDSKLDLNETWVYHCSTTLDATHTNTVVATGWANGISATDIANATVVVGAAIVPPLIHITKIPNPLALSAGGGMITYTETVTNPGMAPLANVNVTDDKCGPVNYISGDTNNDSKLDPTETWVYTCRQRLTKTTTNTAVATGEANGLTERDFAIATVVVAAAIPGLPNTGIVPEYRSIQWYIVIPVSLLFVSFLLFMVRRKQNI